MILFGHTPTFTFIILATPSTLMNLQACISWLDPKLLIELATVPQFVEALTWLKSRI